MMVPKIITKISILTILLQLLATKLPKMNSKNKIKPNSNWMPTANACYNAIEINVYHHVFMTTNHQIILYLFIVSIVLNFNFYFLYILMNEKKIYIQQYNQWLSCRILNAARLNPNLSLAYFSIYPCLPFNTNDVGGAICP